MNYELIKKDMKQKEVVLIFLKEIVNKFNLTKRQENEIKKELFKILNDNDFNDKNIFKIITIKENLKVVYNKLFLFLAKNLKQSDYKTLHKIITNDMDKILKMFELF